jgi:hypothetical protein
MRPTNRLHRAVATAAVVAGAGSAAFASPAHADRIYGGQKASERLQMVFAVADDGATLNSVSLVSELNCRNSYNRADTGTTTSVAALPAAPELGVLYLTGAAITDGRIDATLLLARERGEGRTDTARGRLTGDLTASRGSGRLALTSQTVEDSTGRVLRTCSRTLPWRVARNPGRLFAGSTSQGAPLVLRLSADRRRITSSLIGWVAPCRLASYYLEPHDDWLLPFRLTAGGSFTQSYRYDAGRNADVIGRFAGRFRGDNASGTFRSRVVGGGERCQTGARTWTVATG